MGGGVRDVVLGGLLLVVHGALDLVPALGEPAAGLELEIDFTLRALLGDD